VRPYACEPPVLDITGEEFVSPASINAIQAAVLHRLGQMLGGDALLPVQVRGGAGDLEDAVVRRQRPRWLARSGRCESPSGLGR
jgi:hypothetical protein